MINLHAKLQGEYTISRVKSDGTVVETVGPFKNLITDVGLDSFGKSGESGVAVGRCAVGSSNATPSYSDTQLGSRVAVTSLTGVSYSTGNTPSYHVNLVARYRFEQGSAAGNLSEIGVGVAGSVGRPGDNFTMMLSRALIVDGAGNPTTITVLSDEFLDVTYTLRFFVSDQVGVPYKVLDTTSGVEHTLTSRICNTGNTFVYSYGQLRPTGRNDGLSLWTATNPANPITFSSSVTGNFINASVQAQATTTVDVPYVSESYKVKSVVKVPLSSGNHTNGIGAITTIYSSSVPSIVGVPVGIIISPPILKTSTKTLDIGLSLSWSRV